jgi:hypothetical protein
MAREYEGKCRQSNYTRRRGIVETVRPARVCFVPVSAGCQLPIAPGRTIDETTDKIHRFAYSARWRCFLRIRSDNPTYPPPPRLRSLVQLSDITAFCLLLNFRFSDGFALKKE